jgi:hypothetical protein
MWCSILNCDWLGSANDPAENGNEATNDTANEDEITERGL